MLVPMLIDLREEPASMSLFTARHILGNLRFEIRNRVGRDSEQLSRTFDPYLSSSMSEDLVSTIIAEAKPGRAESLASVTLSMMGAEWKRAFPPEEDELPPLLVAPKSREIYDAIFIGGREHGTEFYPGIPVESNAFQIIVPSLTSDQLDLIQRCFKITDEDCKGFRSEWASHVDEAGVPNIFDNPVVLRGGRMELAPIGLRKYCLSIAKKDTVQKYMEQRTQFSGSWKSMKSVHDSSDLRIFVSQTDYPGDGLSLAVLASEQGEGEHMLAFFATDHKGGIGNCIRRGLPLETLLQQTRVPYLVKMGDVVFRFNPEKGDLEEVVQTEDRVEAYNRVAKEYGYRTAERYLGFFYRD